MQRRPSGSQDWERILQKVYERGVQALDRIDAKLSNTTQEEFNQQVQQRFSAAIERAYQRNPAAFNGQSLEQVKEQANSNWEATRESLKELTKISQEELLIEI